MAELTVDVVVPAPRRTPRRKPKRTETLHPGRINIIVQMRRTYDQDLISEQAANIAELGLLQNPGVAELDHEHAVAYLEFFSRVLGETFTVDQLVIDQNGFYYIAIWGHRRLLSGRMIYGPGCPSCQEKFGAGRPGSCPRRHQDLDHQGFDMQVFYNIEPERAFEKQIAENSYVAPSRENVAEALRENWEAQKALNTKLSKAAFARSVNVGVEFVTNSLLYCELPEEVKQDVKSGLIKFSTAIELTSMVKAELPERYITRVAQQVMSGRLKPAEVKRRVANLVKQYQSDGIDLFADEGTDEEVHVENLRSTLAGRQRYVFQLESQAWLVTAAAVKKGLLPKPAKSESVRNLARRTDELRESLFS